MNRRGLLKAAVVVGSFLAPAGLGRLLAAARSNWQRPRPDKPGWPTVPEWKGLEVGLTGKLLQPTSLIDQCRGESTSECNRVFENIRNPYVIRDSAALTQSLGWADAWVSEPSAYVVAAEHANDVSAAITFARKHRLRLVVKGGGHAYQGTSNARDSLMIWTRNLTSHALHENFTPRGSDRGEGPAVSLGAGMIWQEAYQAVMTEGRRYVQGGGCLTVGVAGLVASGGFGSHSKGFGSAASNLLEAEIVTADGRLRVVNRHKDPELFWALKGGGGGNFGVVTRLTLRTHPLPQSIGEISADIAAHDPASFASLIELAMAFCERRLLSPNWGEQLIFRPRNRMQIRTSFQDIDQTEATRIWDDFFAEVRARAPALTLSNITILAGPGHLGWDAKFLQTLPGMVRNDARTGSPPTNIYWADNAGEVAQFIHGYSSTWLPAELLRDGSRARLVRALADTASRWKVSLHLNKGLAGATEATRALARDTATNPAFVDAFALAILGAEEASVYPGVAGHEPNWQAARQDASNIRAAAVPLRRLIAQPASYVSESDYFETHWQEAFWGANYPRLERIKRRYDPDGLFFAHHMVGSERWSADGFSRKPGTRGRSDR